MFKFYEDGVVLLYFLNVFDYGIYFLKVKFQSLYFVEYILGIIVLECCILVY